MTRQERATRQQYWSQHVQRWRETRQSKAAYIRSEGVNAHQFYYWCRRLEAAPAVASPRRRKATASTASKFIPVQVTPAPSSGNDAPRGLLVQLGDVRVTLPRDASRAELTEWISAIRAAI